MEADADTPHPSGERLSAYTDAELGRAPRAAVERHLRACGRCAATVRGYREVGRALRRVPPRPFPPTPTRERAHALPWERPGPAAGAAGPAVGIPPPTEQERGGARDWRPRDKDGYPL